jgi:hypothetical protein
LTGKSFQKKLIKNRRLDFVTKTNLLEKTNDTLYTLNLKLSTGENKLLMCTLAELEEFYSKLLDATKQIERFSNK